MQITITNLQQKISIPVSKIKSAAMKTAAGLKLAHEDISVVFVGEQRMRRMNREYLGHDYVTDVITFNHGEIVICPAVAESNAATYRNSLHQELLLYVVHGLLHLAGYDDHAPADIARMRDKERQILSSL